MSTLMEQVQAWMNGEVGSGGPCGDYPASADQYVPDGLLEPHPPCTDVDDEFLLDIIDCFQERARCIDNNGCCNGTAWDISCIENNCDPGLLSCLTAARARYEERCTEA